MFTKKISAKPLTVSLHIIQLAVPQTNTLQSLNKKQKQTYLYCKFLQENLVVDSTSTWLHSIVLFNHPKFLQNGPENFLSRHTQSEPKTNLRPAVAGRASGPHLTKPENGQRLWMPFIQGRFYINLATFPWLRKSAEFFFQAMQINKCRAQKVKKHTFPCRTHLADT